MANSSTRAPVAGHATGQGRVRRGYRLAGRDSDLASALARDRLIGEPEELGRVLAAFQQAKLEVSAAVRTHDGVMPTEAETMGSAVSGTGCG